MGSGSETKNAATLPKGKYTLVGIDVDTTGRRLIDEVSRRLHRSFLLAD